MVRRREDSGLFAGYHLLMFTWDQCLHKRTINFFTQEVEKMKLSGEKLSTGAPYITAAIKLPSQYLPGQCDVKVHPPRWFTQTVVQLFIMS